MKGSFDVSKHALVPKHKKLSEKDKKELLERYRITPNELPRISVKDPAIAKLKLQPGDVVQVSRKSPTAGDSVYYRCVVNG
jgi:DNA-directed RNA polymerase subunit H